MLDYGFPYPITQEDRKKSAPFVYTSAAIALIVYAGFAGYEIGFDKGLSEGKKNQVIERPIQNTNNLEKVISVNTNN